jgi:hypothetical protein
MVARQRKNERDIMSFLTRAVISLLAGMGAGLLGFWIVWRSLIGTAWDSIPGPGYDAWLIAGIFVPGVVGALLVFHYLRRAELRKEPV